MTEQPTTNQDVPEGIAALAQRLDGKNPGLTAAIMFDLGEKVFRIVFQDGVCHAEAGPGEANATVSMSAETAQQFFTGELNPMAAFMTGQIKIQGDITVLMALQAGIA